MRELSQKILEEGNIILYSRSIMPIHFDYLLESCGIGEEYDALPLDLKQVEASLQVAHSHLTLEDDEDDIAAKLTHEFLPVGVKFFYEPNPVYLNKVKYPAEGILASEFEPKTLSIIIYVLDRFLENFIKGNYKLLAPTILAIIWHEDMHKQQYKQSGGKIKGLKTTVPVKQLNLDDPKEQEKYLSLPSEIDAHARELANHLYTSGWKGGRIVKALEVGDKNLITYPSYLSYWSHFGTVAVSNKKKNSKDITPEDLKRAKVWDRFRAQVVAYLRTSGKYKNVSKAHFNSYTV